MIFREIFFNNDLIGLIGWNNGKVLIRLKDEAFREQIDILMGNNNIRTAVTVGDISVSSFRIYNQTDKEWLGLLDQKQHDGITLGVISEITKKKFDGLPI